MTKRELANILATQENITQQDAYQYIERLFGIIADTIEQGKDVKIRGFGTFRLAKHKEKQLVHPVTKEKSIIPQRKVITFTVSRSLRNKLNDQ